MRLRVGLLCHHGVGGSARVAVELAHSLREREHEVHVFARATPPGLEPPQAGVIVHTLSTQDAPTTRLDVGWAAADVDALVRRVAAVARDADLDVLHFHYAIPFAAVLGRVAAQLGARAPALVGTLHGSDVSVIGRRGSVRLGLAAILPSFDALTTVSRNHALLAARTFRLLAPPRVIPNFVDLRRFRPHSISALRQTPRVVHVSNFRAIKQPESLARIYCDARRSVDASLWLVGDGDGLPAARALLARAGLAGDMRAFGFRPDPERILPHADVLLVTSRTESFCLVALEAAACGVPAVAPRTGGLPDTVIDGETGVLYPPGDEAAAARALIGLLSDPAGRAELGESARRHAQAFAADAVVPAYEAVYREVLEAPGLQAVRCAR